MQIGLNLWHVTCIFRRGTGAFTPARCLAAFRLIGNIMARDLLLTLLADFERFQSDRAIVYSRGYRYNSWSYAKVASTAALFANALKSRGIRTSDRILLWAPNSAEWVAAFWGCLLVGAVAVPMDDSVFPDFAARVVRGMQQHVEQAELDLAQRGQPALEVLGRDHLLEPAAVSAAYDALAPLTPSCILNRKTAEFPACHPDPRVRPLGRPEGRLQSESTRP